jgi:hypothetical protein
LKCKFNVVKKRDEFRNVLRFSADFGVDTPEGHGVRNGIVGVFADGTFDPNERIHFRNGETLSLSQYASRCNIQLIRTADLNEKLRQRGCEKSLTVQHLCRVCKDENEVREVLDGVWESTKDATAFLNKVARRNQQIFDLEQKLARPTITTSEVKGIDIMMRARAPT